MNTIVEPAFGIVPLDLIRESKTNPRKRFSNAALAELAESIKRSGVGQPILVRPLPDEDGEPASRVEIVAGARRFRASLLAGLATIPAIVRDMSDAEVLEFQLVENLQREDVHPIEEADGYERMMRDLKLTADQVAEKVSKSRSYIYARLKLCALTSEAREAFYDGKLSASTALLIARIPVPKLQAHAIEEVCNSYGGEPMSYRGAQNHLRQRYTLQLSRAAWSVDDAELLSTAGSCAACPKRSGNQPEIYGDLDPDVCTDPDCFESKRIAFFERAESTVQARGLDIFDAGSSQARELTLDADNCIGTNPIWNMERVKPEYRAYRAISEFLKAEQLPPAIAYIRAKNGELIGVYAEAAIQAALERAGICYTEEEQAALDAKEQQAADPKLAEKLEQSRLAAARREETNRRCEQETALRQTTYRRARIVSHDGISDEALRAVLRVVLSETSLPTCLSDLYPEMAAADDDEPLYKFIDAATRAELEKLLMDLTIGHHLNVHPWSINECDGRDDSYSLLAQLAAAHDIDIEQVRAELHPPAPPAEPEDPAKQPEPTEEHADPVAAADPAEPPTDSQEPLAIGDTVRIKDGLKGPNGKARKCCGRTGTISSAVDGAYVVTVGKSNHSQLTRDDLEKVQPAPEPQEKAKPAAPADAYANSAWPFPRGIK